MTDLRKAAQALVDRWDTPLWKDVPHTGQYIDALRAALAQPEQEPVAWKILEGTGVSYLSSEPPPHPSVVASCRPLYPTPPQRKPLNGDEMLEVLKTFYFDGTVTFNTIVRAIEKAHGIGVE